jgi:hypothetical protein
MLVIHNGTRWQGFPMPASTDNEEDPVRHDFGRAETRVSIHWASGGRIHMVWPEEDKDQEKRGYFYVNDEDGSQPRTPQRARSLFSPITIIPVVTPLDRIEELKNPAYVELNTSTRLASRHFRNHAWLMRQAEKWNSFREFCQSWLPEISLLDVSLNAAANRLAIFYSESGSRVPKELAWAGDGIQIWVQLLWHLFSSKDATTIVLDEPEVYLHPDLQRRLVRLLDGLTAQIVLASHSADVIAEAPPEGVLWVDRRLGGARRAKSHQVLSALSSSLGSSFNLALARSMRARLVIATDCEDIRVLRLLAKHVGAVNVSNEHIVSVVQLREVSSWWNTRHLGDSLREVLPAGLPTVVLLSAGFRPQGINDAIRRSLTAPGIEVFFWFRTELENYLVDPDTIARVSGAAPEAITQRLVDATSHLREETRSGLISTWVAAAQEGLESETLSRAEQEFEQLWSVPQRRLDVVRGTCVIKFMNEWLESQGYRVLNSYQLARAIRPQSLPSEVLDRFLGLDEMVQ